MRWLRGTGKISTLMYTQRRLFSVTKARYASTSLTVYTTVASIPALWIISLQFALPLMLVAAHMVESSSNNFYTESEMYIDLSPVDFMI